MVYQDVWNRRLKTLTKGVVKIPAGSTKLLVSRTLVSRLPVALKTDCQVILTQSSVIGQSWRMKAHCNRCHKYPE